jgi:hypothetical protein
MQTRQSEVARRRAVLGVVGTRLCSVLECCWVCAECGIVSVGMACHRRLGVFVWQVKSSSMCVVQVCGVGQWQLLAPAVPAHCDCGRTRSFTRVSLLALMQPAGLCMQQMHARSSLWVLLGVGCAYALAITVNVSSTAAAGAASPCCVRITTAIAVVADTDSDIDTCTAPQALLLLTCVFDYPTPACWLECPSLMSALSTSAAGCVLLPPAQ